MITQPCLSINSWSHRDPERRVSHTGPTTFSHAISGTSKHRQAQTSPEEGPARQRPRPPSVLHAALHPADAGGHCGQQVTRRGREVLPSRTPAGSTCWLQPPPPPESHAHQRQTPYIFPRERSAGLVLARDIETHVQGQDKVLWAANVSQAPCSFCSSEKQGPGPDAWPSACSSCFQGPGATDQVLESSGRVVQGHEAETDAQHAGLGTEVHQHVQLRLNRPAQRCL